MRVRANIAWEVRPARPRTGGPERARRLRKDQDQGWRGATAEIQSGRLRCDRAARPTVGALCGIDPVHAIWMVPFRLRVVLPFWFLRTGSHEPGAAYERNWRVSR